MKSVHYDAVVVGSGFGGATAAYELSRAGCRTLLLERGDWAHRDSLDWNPRSILLDKRYRSPSPLSVRQYGDPTFKPMDSNQVVGGMSVFYGGASLRLRERDFEHWPFAYDELEPYYGRAEELLGVHGETGTDPYEPRRSTEYPFAAIELTGPSQRLAQAAEKIGLHPFKIPLAINFKGTGPNHCIQCLTCDGFPCRIEAKNDLATTLLKRAQNTGLDLMAGTTVARLIEKEGHIKTVECIDHASGRTFQVKTQSVILSAGALHSPAILLRSGLERFPNATLIGRHLMRHCNAVVTGIFPFATNPEGVFHKQLCFADFYEDSRDRFGTATGIVQDIYTPAAEVIAHSAPKGSGWIAGRLAPYMQNLLCIAEDEPQWDNRVTLSPKLDPLGLEAIQVEHEYGAADLERRDYLVARTKKVLKAAGCLFTWLYPIDTFSHAVGTLRFGLAPSDSVLDRDCRFWGVDNLFVLDGSFMPTSAGVNPSLTIAANALRVAERITAQLKGS